jgi:hypothetical protein
MARSKPTAVAAVTVLILAGCGMEAKYVSKDPTVLSPKPKGYDMPFSYETPARPHKILGEVMVSSTIKPNFRETSTFDQILAEMKKRAKKVGADAIVNLKTMDSQERSKRGKLTLVGTLIIYTAPPELSAGIK